MESKSKCAIVSLAIGSNAERLASLTHPVMAAYGNSIGADFVVIRNARINPKEPKMEKFQLYDILAIFDRVLYLDVDTIVMPNCPDLFALVPKKSFGAFFDSYGANGDADIPKWRREEIDYFQQNQGHIGWEETYFNSGVMVISRIHRRIFDYSSAPKAGKRVVDQTQINYNVQHAKIPVFDIGQKFNHMTALSRSQRMMDTRFSSHIIHYAGFQYFYPRKSLYNLIKQDIYTAYHCI